MTEPTIFDLSSPGRIGFQYPESDVTPTPLPEELMRRSLLLPELSELDVVRHFTHLSRLNYSVDSGFYPLGSCTMKYNPKVNEEVARLSGFTNTHPLQPVETVQANLLIMFQLQEWLKEISGFKGVCLAPAAGAQGEFVGVMIIRAFHASQGQEQRRRILIPDSAHGTNPASSTMSGLEVVSIPSDSRGNIDLAELERVCDENTAGLMLTNPNTLGLFDENVVKVIDIVHKAGGLVYGDGANFNALLGITRPADLGFDVMHFNLHKTFSTPHGGGGPGSGPVGVTDNLVDFLPNSIVDVIDPGDNENPPLYGFKTPAKSIGNVKSFHGQFGMIIRAFAYIAMHGGDGLRKVSECAVLNANYLLACLRGIYPVPYDRTCMHEFVIEGRWPNVPDIHALDIAKRLMDYDFHPPTNYFPLIVHEALMIEPTETESKQTLDAFSEALIQIATEARSDPQVLKSAPHYTPIMRVDEIKAARDLVLCCHLPDSEDTE